MRLDGQAFLAAATGHMARMQIESPEDIEKVFEELDIDIDEFRAVIKTVSQIRGLSGDEEKLFFAGSVDALVIAVLATRFAEGRAFRALAKEASDLLGERAPGAAAMFDEAAECGTSNIDPMNVVSLNTLFDELKLAENDPKQPPLDFYAVGRWIAERHCIEGVFERP